MGNSQSAAERDAGERGDSTVDPRLRRFHTGVSDNVSTSGIPAVSGTESKKSTSPAPPLRRTSTTATGTASEKRHASLGRSGSSSLSRGSHPLEETMSLGRKSGTVSAAASPRASERERAWVRSATRRSSTMSSGAGESAPSPSRGRSRSGSIGNFLGRNSRGATLYEDQVLDHRDDDSLAGGKRAELTYRRKKSIDLTDVVDAPSALKGVIKSAPSSRLTLTSGRSTTNPSSSILSPTTTGVETMPSFTDQSNNLSGMDAEEVNAGPNDVYNPLYPEFRKRTSKDPLGRSQPAAFPSYLKIPTLIPSTYASPTSSAPSSPSATDMKGWPGDEPQYNGTFASAFPTKIGAGGTAAAAILNTEDVLIKPGGASKASTPTEERTPEKSDETVVEVTNTDDESGKLEEKADGGANGVPSRTTTPTPGNLKGTGGMTPNPQQDVSLSAISPAPSNASTTSTYKGDHNYKRGSLQMYTGLESGQNTPGLTGLGLTSAPSSALTPNTIPTYNQDLTAKEVSLPTSAGPSAPLAKNLNALKLSVPQQGAGKTATASSSPATAKASSATPTRNNNISQLPLMPITVRWRGGGKEVFVTGTFANEWRSKILLKKTAGIGKKAEYSCVLHLAPGTHRLKFIVDDRWRVSRDLSTASDGEGNLTNYIEVAHTGPAHPGPLSAPGEDLLLPEDEDDKRKKGIKEPGLSAHKATLDLIEEARKAEALRRGDLMDVFGDDKVRKEDIWTQDIPEAIVKAQAAEEAQRIEAEAQAESGLKHTRRESSHSYHSVPAPPMLPRQLEKVILNSSPAAVAGAVDDNSVLPAPNHAVLHHLTASAIKSGVIATGCTMRYRKKYITTIYYRAAN